MISSAIFCNTKHMIIIILTMLEKFNFSASTSFFNSVGWSRIKYGKYFSGKIDQEQLTKT